MHLFNERLSGFTLPLGVYFGSRRAIGRSGEIRGVGGETGVVCNVDGWLIIWISFCTLVSRSLVSIRLATGCESRRQTGSRPLRMRCSFS